MSFTVTDDAIDAFDLAAGQLKEGTQNIKDAVAALKTAFEDNKDGLGAHSDDISSLIEDLEGLITSANSPVLQLVMKLKSAANIRREHIKNNTYSGMKI